MMFPGNLLGAWRKSAIEALASTKRLPTESREGQKSTLLRNFVRCAFQVTFYAHWFAFVAEKVPKLPPRGGVRKSQKVVFFCLCLLGAPFGARGAPGYPTGCSQEPFFIVSRLFSHRCSFEMGVPGIQFSNI